MWLQSVRYLASTFLWFFLNPFGFWQGMAQALGQTVAVIRSFIVNSTTPQESIPMSLPFEGWWTVAKGGVNKRTSHSWSVIAQRYAYDFYITDNDGRSHRDSGRRLEDYYSFGKAVLAPADGTVIEVRDNVRDFPSPGTGQVDWRTRDLRGNYIIIRHGQHVYSLIAHLKQGTCRVKRGDWVQRGQVIGECGNSGHSTEPHIHFHLQNHPNFYLAIGLPIQFRDFGIQGPDSDNVERHSLGYISKGQKVANLPDEQGVAWHDKDAAKVIGTTVNFWDFISNLVLSALTILGIFRVLAGVVRSILQLMLGI